MSDQTHLLFVLTHPVSFRLLILFLTGFILVFVRRRRLVRWLFVAWACITQFGLIFSLGGVRKGLSVTSANLYNADSEAAKLDYLQVRWERVLMPNYSTTVIVWLTGFVIIWLVVKWLKTFIAKQSVTNL